MVALPDNPRQVALIDQDISITLRNLSREVPFPEKIFTHEYVTVFFFYHTYGKFFEKFTLRDSDKW